MLPNIGVSEANREGVCRLLNTTLADEFVLTTRTRNYHWHVAGPQFYPLHLLFEKQYEELDDFIDDLAERIRSLGGVSLGTLSEFVQHARLKEVPGDRPGPREMVHRLLTDHEALVQQLRHDVTACNDKYQDVGTADFLTGLMERHEKMAWMLRASLQMQG